MITSALLAMTERNAFRNSRELGIMNTKKHFFIFLFFSFSVFLFFGFPIFAQKSIELYFFYKEGCPYCAEAKPFLENLEKKYPQLKVREFEISGDEKNQKLFFLLADAYGQKIEGVPTIYIGDKVISGFNEMISFQIEQAVQDCIQGVQNEGEAGVLPFQLCFSPIEKLKTTARSPEKSSRSPKASSPREPLVRTPGAEQKWKFSHSPEVSSPRGELISAIILFLILGMIVLGGVKLIKKKLK